MWNLQVLHGNLQVLSGIYKFFVEFTSPLWNLHTSLRIVKFSSFIEEFT
jgi:hypothetical protein